ncbi:MAG TPA: substrate-binding domain-containing protein [Jiangellaceae bacterium]
MTRPLDAPRSTAATATGRGISAEEAAAVPLSSVRQPREQLGRTAMELLLDEVDNGGRHAHRQVVFQPELIVRESSEPVGDH